MEGRQDHDRREPRLEREEIRIRKRSVLLVGSRHVGSAGLRSILHELPDVWVVADVAQGPETVDAAKRLQPDHILVGTDGIADDYVELLHRLHEASGRSTITVFSDHVDRETLTTLGKVPIDGYLAWIDLTPETLVACLTLESAGIRVGSAAAVDAVVAGPEPRGPFPVGSDLSNVELDALRGLMAGQTEKQLAAHLGVGERTVHGVIAKLKRELNAPSLFALGVRAHALGIIR